MELLQLRKWYYPNATIGEILIQRQASSLAEVMFDHECFSLEDHYPNPYVKTPRKTAIPEGRYQIRLTFSPKFKQVMPLLFNVETPDGRLLVQGLGATFEGVRIHWGNRNEDTDGCDLVGAEADLENHTIGHSIAAYERLMIKLKACDARKEEMHITIKDARAQNG